MNYVKSVGIFMFLFCFFIVNAMEQETGLCEQHVVYIRNKSEYPVRISVGPDYPPSIALDPGQTMEFPVDKIETIVASSYGKYTNFLSGVVAKLGLKELINDNKIEQQNDHVVEITYQEASSSGLLWFVKYLFTQGKWALSFEEINSENNIFDAGKIGGCIDDLYKKIKGASKDVSDEVIKDASLIWSMFPRAASKIASASSVYPFNILSLDIGGFVASEKQLQNWADLLFSSLKKHFVGVESNAVWNAVNMLITDAIESLLEGKYYATRDQSYLERLLYRSGSVKSEAEMPVELITQLEEQVKDDVSALAILAQLKAAAKKKVAPPPAPPAPDLENIQHKNYRENSINRYLKALEKKLPEEKTLLDKVIAKVFGLINELNNNNPSDEDDLERKKILIELRYCALQKLQLLEQHKHGIKRLNQINKYMNPTMMCMILLEDNRQTGMEQWIDHLASCESQKAYKYAQLNLPDLQDKVEAENAGRAHQLELMAHLRKNVARFREGE